LSYGNISNRIINIIKIFIILIFGKVNRKNFYIVKFNYIYIHFTNLILYINSKLPGVIIGHWGTNSTDKGYFPKLILKME